MNIVVSKKELHRNRHVFEKRVKSGDAVIVMHDAKLVAHIRPSDDQWLTSLRSIEAEG